MKKKLIIIANCQALPISKLLMMSPDVDDIVAIPIHLYQTKHFDSFDKKFKSLQNEEYLHILSCKISNVYNEYSLESLQKKYANVSTFTNIFFTGLHPDITYVGDRLGRIQSPLGDYHSKIIFQSFLKGISVDGCISRFNGAEYERLGYFDEFDKSSKELIMRDQDNDIKFSSILLELLRNSPSLYTVNHPTGHVFHELNSLISKVIGIKYYQFPKEMISNHLANSAWWPIYQEIKEYHNLKYEMPFVFKIPDNLGGKMLTLEEFIMKSYEIYFKDFVRISKTKQASLLLNIF